MTHTIRMSRPAVVAALVFAAGLSTLGLARADEALPDWLARLVAQIEREPVRNPPAEIWRGHYRGLVVYFETPHCCDVPSRLFNAAGQRLCEPNGGLTGRGDGRCPDADIDDLKEERVWRDPRARP